MDDPMEAYRVTIRKQTAKITTLQARVGELEGALDLAGEGAVGAAKLLAEVESARSALAEEVEELNAELASWRTAADIKQSEVEMLRGALRDLKDAAYDIHPPRRAFGDPNSNDVWDRLIDAREAARAALEPQPQPESEEGATIYVREAERYRKALIVAGWDPQREGVNEWAKRVGMKIDRAGPR